MTKEEKKEKIEGMALIFEGIDNVGYKSISMMVMSAYTEGIMAGQEQERKRIEQEKLKEA